MRLTRYTDYAMRVLLHLGGRPDSLCSVAEISRAYAVSQNHLMKVVNDLVREGYVASVRGRFGGVRLGRAAREINVGAVVRYMEDGFDLADCETCIIAPACGLNGALHEALAAFLAVLDRYTLDDLITRRLVWGGGSHVGFPARRRARRKVISTNAPPAADQAEAP